MTGVTTSEMGNKSLRPTLPKVEEQKDDMGAYKEQFKQFAKIQGWREDKWAVKLGSLLKGKGLEVYTSKPPEQANDYLPSVEESCAETLSVDRGRFNADVSWQ